MTRQKRLSSKIQRKRPRRKFWFPAIFVVGALIVGGSAAYFFLQKNHERPLERSSPSSEQTLPVLASSPSGEEKGDDTLLEDLFADSELIHLYKVGSLSKETMPSYWTWALTPCVSKGPHLAVMITGTASMSKKDVRVLTNLGIPFGIVVSPNNSIHSHLSSFQQKGLCSLFLEVPSTEDAKGLEAILSSLDWVEGHLTGIVGHFDASSKKEDSAWEAIFSLLRSRDLLLINSAQELNQKLEKIAQQTLLLSLHRDWTLDPKKPRSLSILQKDLQKKSGILFVTLQDLLSAQGRQWVQLQKRRKIQFVSPENLFCRHTDTSIP